MSALISSGIASGLCFGFAIAILWPWDFRGNRKRSKRP